MGRVTSQRGGRGERRSASGGGGVVSIKGGWRSGCGPSYSPSGARRPRSLCRQLRSVPLSAAQVPPSADDPGPVQARSSPDQTSPARFLPACLPDLAFLRLPLW